MCTVHLSPQHGPVLPPNNTFFVPITAMDETWDGNMTCQCCTRAQHVFPIKLAAFPFCSPQRTSLGCVISVMYCNVHLAPPASCPAFALSQCRPMSTQPAKTDTETAVTPSKPVRNCVIKPPYSVLMRAANTVPVVHTPCHRRLRHHEAAGRCVGYQCSFKKFNIRSFVFNPGVRFPAARCVVWR